MSLPKVLIIGQPFNNTGGGITLTNLFRGWDKDKLAVACLSSLDNIDTSICDRYYRLGEKERKGKFPFTLFQSNHPSGPPTFTEARFQNVRTVKPTLRTKLIMNVIFPFLKYFGVWHSISKTELSPEFCQWVDDFKPDILYGQASSRDGVLFCSALYDHLRIPFIFHMMDDWPSIVSTQGPFKKFWHNRIDREFRHLLDKADVLMSIGEKMTSEYKTRYNKSFIPFQNPLNIDFWKSHQRTQYELGDPPTILYAGRIGLGIDSSIETFAKAVAQSNQELGTHVKLILHTEVPPDWISTYPCVEHRSLVPHADLPRVLAEADFLLLPYDFSTKSIQYIRYSMPTKGPEYMISGTPVIIFAPKETAIAEYADQYGFAGLITKNDVAAISETIKKLIQHQELRNRLAKKAIETAERNHDSNIVTRNFRQAISSVMTRPQAAEQRP
jgi:glycosyltransferase involved in cell wall biosynthesis